MFGLLHISYMVISAIITAALLFLFSRKASRQESKDKILKFFAVITVVIHISSLWVDFFKEGSASVPSVMLIPIHPCNVLMWLLVIIAFMKNKNSTLFRLLAEFCFFGGIVCGSIGIILNENFGNNPTFADYDVFKGMLSHSTMLLGCIYVLVGKYIKIRVKNLLGVITGLLIFFFDGLIINWLYSVFELDPCNSMYLLEAPFPDMPWLVTPVMGAAGIALAFAITAIYEQIALPKEERWYTLLKQKLNKN